MPTNKLWDKGIPLDEEIEDFTVGEDYILDMKLVKYDCIASIAHAKMLGKMGILKEAEVNKLVNELNNIKELSEEGKFTISKKQEDVHTAIENMLTEALGELGGKIHTGRSRNDQVLTALRLYYKDNIAECISLSKQYIVALHSFSSNYGGIVLPGYTHTRKAMPSSIRLWSGALIDSMQDNITLLEATLLLVDQSPLGTGAGYGVPIKLDRNMTAKELGFAKVQENPIYVQLSRGKFESTILHVLTQIMLDMNRAATDLIIFSMPELGYFELPDKFTTGSSIMPQKKNPDVLELLRAKYHLVVSYEMQVKGISGNLLTGYNRDMQLTKKPVMEGFEVTEQSLKVAARLLGGLKVNKDKAKKGLTSDVYATDEAYRLVKNGISFRDAYKTVSKKYTKSN
ncbi:MAG: argininosuccinate lyase [Candidatus Micrarchaeota archaeon]|nr:argininosuccinate lyase [Candidatus Micrarchaeota archaeon]MDE1859552.1 argininosuccinate lyase [Candidatus Micrarchaeota archaeon]